MTAAEYEDRVIIGDAAAELTKLPDELVQCVVTSPPYWGLRNYQVEGQLGLEVTIEEYVDKIRSVFRELRRVLKSDGTLWLNMGDCYAGSWSGNSMRPEGGSQRPGSPGFQQLDSRYAPRNGAIPKGLKPKDLVGIPWRVAFALQADGWWLRSDVIWNKTNAIPHPIKDRPTTSHEYLFLLARSRRYYYDHEAIKEPIGEDEDEPTDWRNRRSVWTLPTGSFPGAHFATFPEKLVEPCILAGSRPGDLVLDPFAGSGTTLQVAAEHRRKYLGIELSPEYEKLIAKRLREVQPSLELEEGDSQ